MSEEQLLTTDKVALWLDMPDRRVMDLARRGDLPAFKVGKEWRFSKEEITQFLESQRDKSRRDLTPNA